VGIGKKEEGKLFRKKRTKLESLLTTSPK